MPKTIDQGLAASLSREYRQLMEHNDLLQEEKKGLVLIAINKIRENSNIPETQSILEGLNRNFNRINQQMDQNKLLLDALMKQLLLEETTTPASSVDSTQQPVQEDAGLEVNQLNPPFLLSVFEKSPILSFLDQLCCFSLSLVPDLAVLLGTGLLFYCLVLYAYLAYCLVCGLPKPVWVRTKANKK